MQRSDQREPTPGGLERAAARLEREASQCGFWAGGALRCTLNVVVVLDGWLHTVDCRRRTASGRGVPESARCTLSYVIATDDSSRARRVVEFTKSVSVVFVIVTVLHAMKELWVAGQTVVRATGA